LIFLAGLVRGKKKRKKEGKKKKKSTGSQLYE